MDAEGDARASVTASVTSLDWALLYSPLSLPMEGYARTRKSTPEHVMKAKLCSTDIKSIAEIPLTDTQELTTIIHWQDVFIS